MIQSPLPLRLLAAVSLCLFVASYAVADPFNDDQLEAAVDQQQVVEASKSKPKTTAAKKSSAKAKAKKPKYPPFKKLLGKTKCIDGLIKLYKKDKKLYAELPSKVMKKDLLVAISIARGIGKVPLVGGWTVRRGDDWIWQFRKVDDRIHIMRRNVRYLPVKGSQDYGHDSIIYVLPIATKHGGNCVVDLTGIFMSDLAKIGGFKKDWSRWGKIKGFKNNVEIEIEGKFTKRADTVAESGAATIHVHYSVSLLPKTGYKPRPADDRVGHFITVVKDLTKPGLGSDLFVRYVNRWDLRKLDSSADMSLPVKPIVFWIEKTVPAKYRLAVHKGIMEWNKAFERAGFLNAIEVRQQPKDAVWDPEDINYNTVRWITSNWTFAIGPSRVNPMTGQILDSDILIDSSFIDAWTKWLEFEKPGLAADQPEALSSMSDLLKNPLKDPHCIPLEMSHRHRTVCDCARGMSRQLALGAMALAARDKPADDKPATKEQKKKQKEQKKKRKEQIEKLVLEGLKAIVTHEVGHSLGLRHNFKASAYMTLEEISDPEKTRDVGLAASVMDYVPVNIAPKGRKQGDYFSKTIGPYDYWAIEYAYKPAKDKELAKIASRCAEPALQYATDEDNIFGLGSDPLVNRFDLGKNPLEFARWRVELVNELLPGLVDQVTEPGQGYQQVRRAFLLLMREHGLAMHFVARYIGGVYIHRDHKGDPNSRPPFVVTEAKKQREALEFLEEQVFGPEAYQFPPEFYNFLVPHHWMHWGMRGRLVLFDFPVHQLVASLQDRVLNQVLAPLTLIRLLNSELKVPAKQDAFTAAELLRRLTAAIFSETEKLQDGKFTDREPAISSLRRDLQRRYFKQLAQLAIGGVFAPADCQTVAYAELEALEARLKQVLAGKAQLDAYSRSHVSELSARIRKVLDARLALPKP